MAVGNLVFLVLLGLVFYFMLIRPQKRRVEQHRQLVESLAPGDEIVTIGGLFGTIRSLGDQDLELEVSSGTTVRLLKNAVSRKVGDEEELEAGDEEEEGPGE